MRLQDNMAKLESSVCEYLLSVCEFCNYSSIFLFVPQLLSLYYATALSQRDDCVDRVALILQDQIDDVSGRRLRKSRNLATGRYQSSGPVEAGQTVCGAR